MSKWSNEGVTVAGNGKLGKVDCQLNKPKGIFIDQYDNLYVADANNHRVQKFVPDLSVGETIAGDNSGYELASNHLQCPTSVFVDSAGNLFVADTKNNQIQKFPTNSKQGITVVKCKSPRAIFVTKHDDLYVSTSDNVLKYSLSNSTHGTVVAENLNDARGIFVAEGKLGNNDLYVADRGHHCIQKFIHGSDTSGVTVWGVKGEKSSDSNHLNFPNDLILDFFGNMYIADHGNHRIQKVKVQAGTAETIAGITSRKIKDNYHLHYPKSVAFDSKQNLYVSDAYNRVQKFLLKEETVADEFDEPDMVDAETNEHVPTTVNDNLKNKSIPELLDELRTSLDDIFKWESDPNKIPASRLPDLAYFHLLETCDEFEKHEVKHGQIDIKKMIEIMENLTKPRFLNFDDVRDYWIGIDESLKRNPKTSTILYTILRSFKGTRTKPVYTTILLDSIEDYINEKSPETQLLLIVIESFGFYAWCNYFRSILTHILTKEAQKISMVFVTYMIKIIETTQRNYSSTSHTTAALPSDGTSENTTTAKKQSLKVVHATSSLIYDDLMAEIKLQFGDHQINSRRVFHPCCVARSKNTPYSTLLKAFIEALGLEKSVELVSDDRFRVRLFRKMQSSACITKGQRYNEMCKAFKEREEWSSNGITVAGNGTCGSSSTQLHSPYGLYIDQDDNLYVSDDLNHRVQKFKPNSNVGVTVAGGNGQGKALHQLKKPKGVFVDSAGNIFVADRSNNRIQKWEKSSTKGVTVAECTSPFHVVVNKRGDLYVSAMDGVIKYALDSKVGTVVTKDLTSPAGICVVEDDQVGDILYVAEYDKCCIKKFVINSNTDGETVFSGKHGVDAYDSKVLYNVTADSSGNFLYTVDSSSHHVQRVNLRNGTTERIAGVTNKKGSDDKHFNYPTSLAFDSKRNLYVTDKNNCRVQQFLFEGKNVS